MDGSQQAPAAQKKKFLVKIFSFAVLAIIVAAVGLLFGGISTSVEEFSVEIAQRRADVIFASAELDNSTIMSVPILYYDQEMDECVNLYDEETQALLNARQFEWSDCGYYASGIETGMVEDELNLQYLPVARGGHLLSNRGVTPTGFTRWFSSVEGVSESYAGSLSLTYSSAISSFGYTSDSFYPLDKITSGENATWGDGHNHLFTLNLGVPFQVLANGEEKFTITADDDTWVFIDKDLVLDMGGIHKAVSGSFIINDSGEVYTSVDGEGYAYSGIRLSAGDGAIVRIFHADRDSEESVFKLYFNNIVPNITNSSLARNDGGVEVAYDPMDPSYVAPLGESLRVNPDRTRSLTLAITVQAMLMGVLAVIFVTATSLAWRYWRDDRSQAE